jgi:hypothetical protein
MLLDIVELLRSSLSLIRLDLFFISITTLTILWRSSCAFRQFLNRPVHFPHSLFDAPLTSSA